MSDATFNRLFHLAKQTDDRADFIRQYINEKSAGDSEKDRERRLGTTYDLAHVTTKQIREFLCMTQQEFSVWSLCPKRTVENWEYNNTCSDTMRVALALRAGIYEEV